MTINQTYYFLKPLIPRTLQLFLRRQLVKLKYLKYASIWPIDYKSADLPKKWSGWPESKKFALVLTHDVDTLFGQDKCYPLMMLEQELGFKSSFNFIPERYDNSAMLKRELQKNGFEIGVHGLNHDGKLYQNRDIFQERAKKINRYIKEWQAVGFRSPAMHHNLEWIHDLDILYDSSTFDTDPFEPQSDGVRTIFPFIVKSDNGRPGYIEMPYTLPQDFLIFVLMKEQSSRIWKTKLDWIAKKGGMALLNVHPDYICFDSNNIGKEEYNQEYYIEFLTYVKEEYRGQYWHVLPRELAQFWRAAGI